jgi:uncharacterized protein YqfA (UPF0365 family)
LKDKDSISRGKSYVLVIFFAFLSIMFWVSGLRNASAVQVLVAVGFLLIVVIQIYRWYFVKN